MLTRYTSEIFDILRRGQFICSNSPDDNIRKLYNILDEEETYKELYDYFIEINYILEKGEEYFFFSRNEKSVDIERKLEKAFLWIDIVDFFNTFDTAFDVGFRFTPSEIHNQLKNNADLKSKLENLKGINSDKKNYLERINKLIDRTEKEGFISLENEMTETYKVLTSYNYLKDLIKTINIPENLENEIPG